MTNGPARAVENDADYVGDRRYTAAFSDVWETVLAAVHDLRGWSVQSSDSQAGTVRIETAGLLGGRPHEAQLRVSLDEVGWTRLEMRMDRSRRGFLAPIAPQRVSRYLGRVDRMLRAPRAGPHR